MKRAAELTADWHSALTLRPHGPSHIPLNQPFRCMIEKYTIITSGRILTNLARFPFFSANTNYPHGFSDLFWLPYVLNLLHWLCPSYFAFSDALNIHRCIWSTNLYNNSHNTCRFDASFVCFVILWKKFSISQSINEFMPIGTRPKAERYKNYPNYEKHGNWAKPRLISRARFGVLFKKLGSPGKPGFAFPGGAGLR